VSTKKQVDTYQISTPYHPYPCQYGSGHPLTALPLGHTVLSFDDGLEAVQQAKNHCFDVAFVGLPRPDGFDLISRLANSQPDSETSVVMLSATDEVEMLRKAFGAGAKFVLPKPIAAARIIPMLNAMESPQWEASSHAARLPLFTEVHCKWGGQAFPMQSMNISETGMLLQSLAGHGEDVQSLGDKGFGNWKAGAAAKIDHRGTAWQSAGPLAYFNYADAGRTATASAG